MHLKKLDYDTVPVHLVKGEQHADAYAAMNPSETVPTLINDGHVFTQSLAIVEYLDEMYPNPPLLPETAVERARVRALAQVVACDMHFVNNLRVLNYLQNTLELDEHAKTSWYRHWVKNGFDALEEMLLSDPATGKFCHGDTPTLADICLIPQVYNALRFKCPMEGYPTIQRIYMHAVQHPAFAAASPERQVDVV